MYKNVFLVCLLLFSIMAKAQIYNPIKWKTGVQKISDTEYELQAQAIIESGWHLYSQNVADGGPIPTHFTFQKGTDFQLLGEVTEEKGKTINDPVFKMQIKFFEKETTFKQRIKIIATKPLKIKTEVEFMVCNDENCLPPSYDELEFNINPIAVTLQQKETVPEITPKAIITDSLFTAKTPDTISAKKETTPPIKK